MGERKGGTEGGREEGGELLREWIRSDIWHLTNCVCKEVLC